MVVGIEAAVTPHFDGQRGPENEVDLTGGAAFPMFRLKREADSAKYRAVNGG